MYSSLSYTISVHMFSNQLCKRKGLLITFMICLMLLWSNSSHFWQGISIFSGSLVTTLMYRGKKLHLTVKTVCLCASVLLFWPKRSRTIKCKQHNMKVVFCMNWNWGCHQVMVCQWILNERWQQFSLGQKLHLNANKNSNLFGYEYT